MLANVFPAQQLLQNELRIPSSKSLAHRSIICASLAKGTSLISNIDMSLDIQATMACMRELGATIEEVEEGLLVTGISSFAKKEEYTLECNESGSTLRFMIPIASLCHKKVHVHGTKRLLERPQAIYKEIFEKQNLLFVQDEEGIHIQGALTAQEYVIAGNVSSQFISGLLFTLPLCDGDSIIHITGTFESRSYVDLTIQMLQTFGVNVHFVDDCTIAIKGNQEYIATNVAVEADYSQLAFFAVLSALGKEVTCLGANPLSLQGDKAILDILSAMGCQIEWQENGVVVKPQELQATTIDLQNCPDLGPVLFTCASLAKGTTHFIHAKRLRIKESDRIYAMECELKKLGVEVHSTEDEAWVTGVDHWNTPCDLHGHNDHRIVMALAIGAIVSKYGVTIDDAQAVRKSYPHFFEDLAKLGVDVMKKEI